MGDFVSVIAMRPVTFFILLTVAVFLLPSIVIPYWYNMMKKVEHNVEMGANYSRYQVVSKIEDAAKFLSPNYSSATNLASILGFEDNKQLSFSDIETEVARALFEAQKVIPHATQVSYIGLDGLFFSYIIHGDQTYAIYSNSSFASNSTTSPYTWYMQQANSDNGALYGEAKITEPTIVVKEAWFQRAMSSPNGYASLGYRWTSNAKDEFDLILDTARLGGRGAISLGFAVKELTNLFSSIDLNGGSLYMATTTLGEGNKVLLEGIKEAKIEIMDGGNYALVQGISNNNIVGEIPCETINGGDITLDIGETRLIFYCSTIDIARLSTVYVLAFPSEGMVSNVHKHTKVALMLLIIIMVAMVIAILAFVALIVRAARREVHLCAAYMKQMEKTSQTERKSMKQSLAFASANHDIRGYMACIKGLIDLSLFEVPPSSELASNLRKMNNCAEDLLELVNSILDLSKIEAGKMQLEEGEFNLSQLLEDIADLHHPVAMKKGVEVILDPCDGSVMKFSNVKGDKGKLKQILSNLLSNAVKFTPNGGHISIRAWAKKPSLENSIIASNKNNFFNRLSRFFYKNKRAYNDVEEMKTVKQDPNCMEFEFCVEDTGPGIPKEKRESIFENFVQVKENSVGQVGTGLGLGIVQSLVRLMGGDIEVVDKANGEKGTCFKFNIFLIVNNENNSPMVNPRQDKAECQDIPCPSSGCSSSARSPRAKRSLVVLLIKNDERRRMVQRYMESLGIKLVVVKRVSQLPRALKRKVKPKLNMSRYNSSSGKSDLSPTRGSFGLSGSSDQGCAGGSKLFPLSAMDGVDEILPVHKRATSSRGSVRCTLLIIDANAGNFQELCRSVAEFRKDHHRSCIKVVWLERPDTRGAHFPGLEDQNLPSTDCIISEPLHGSRLTRVIGLLPEYGGQLVRVPSMKNLSSNEQSETDGIGSSSGGDQIQRLSLKKGNEDAGREAAVELKSSRTKVSHGAMQESFSEGSEKENSSTRKRGDSSSEKPLLGKKIMVAASNEVTRMIVKAFLLSFGAVVDLCQNGKEVVECFCRAMDDQSQAYDYILMETQMDILNGYQATKIIRTKEENYRIHTPIFGLTCDMSNEELQRITEAGMDFHLPIPIRRDALLEALMRVEKNPLIAERCGGQQAREVQNDFVGGTSSSKSLGGKKFLIAEDSPMLRKLAASFLTRLGACVEVCENGREAFDLICKALCKASEFPYDYILMDCQMPVMDGFEATRRIREEERKYDVHIPIIALTAHEVQEEGRKIIEAGMDYHLTKPLKKETLLEAIRLIHNKFSNVKN